MILSIDGNPCESNQVRRVQCASWDDFVQAVRRVPAIDNENGAKHFGYEAIFRGHYRPDWRLSSRLERAISTEEFIDSGEVTGGLRQLQGTGWYDQV
jgi:hypothetical protein